MRQLLMRTDWRCSSGGSCLHFGMGRCSLLLTWKVKGRLQLQLLLALVRPPTLLLPVLWLRYALSSSCPSGWQVAMLAAWQLKRWQQHMPHHLRSQTLRLAADAACCCAAPQMTVATAATVTMVAAAAAAAAVMDVERTTAPALLDGVR